MRYDILLTSPPTPLLKLGEGELHLSPPIKKQTYGLQLNGIIFVEKLR